MKSSLTELISQHISYEERISNSLLEMDVFFQNHLWDGFSDENDPKFITPDDFEAIQALTDKMMHMILNIGCPNSVVPMLESISERKIKHWVGINTHHNNYSKGKKLNTKDCINRIRKTKDEFDDINKMVIKGHFRWNNRGYMLSRRATDLLALYLIRL